MLQVIFSIAICTLVLSVSLDPAFGLPLGHQQKRDESKADNTPIPKNPITAYIKALRGEIQAEESERDQVLSTLRHAAVTWWESLPAAAKDRVMYMLRMRKCIARLGSKQICENNTAFYLWAQLLARDIMAGKLG